VTVDDEELKRLNETAVSAADLRAFARDLERPEGATTEGFIDAMLKRWVVDRHKGMSIYLRMDALVHLMRQTTPLGTEVRKAPEDFLFTIASTLALRRHGDNLMFDEAEFLERLRALS